jgi:hypothetical protein
MSRNSFILHLAIVSNDEVITGIKDPVITVSNGNSHSPKANFWQGDSKAFRKEMTSLVKEIADLLEREEAEAADKTKAEQPLLF